MFRRDLLIDKDLLDWVAGVFSSFFFVTKGKNSNVFKLLSSLTVEHTQASSRWKYDVQMNNLKMVFLKKTKTENIFFFFFGLILFDFNNPLKNQIEVVSVSFGFDIFALSCLLIYERVVCLLPETVRRIGRVISAPNQNCAALHPLLSSVQLFSCHAMLISITITEIGGYFFIQNLNRECKQESKQAWD